MFQVRDFFEGRVNQIKSLALDAVESLESYAEEVLVEYFDPREAKWEVVQAFSEMSAAIDFAELEKLKLFDDSLEDFIAGIEHAAQGIAERFKQWTQREMINTRQAMEHYGRSRSTIYRWIKSGKLTARKVGRFWQIAL